MKVTTHARQRLASGGRALCAAALGLSLAVFGAAPALALGDTASDISMGQLMGATDDADADYAAQEGFVGTWTLVGMGGDELGFELGADAVGLMDDFGFALDFQVNADGTFAMAASFDGQSEEVEGVWEQLDGTTASFEANDTAIYAEMNADGTITIEDSGVYMTLGRVDDVAAGKFAGTSANASVYLDDPREFTHTWKLVAMDLPGTDNDISEELFSFAEVVGFQGFLNAYDDGTFTLEVSQGSAIDSEFLEGDWELVSQTEALFTVDGESILGTIEDGRMLLTSPDDDETVLIFAALDPEARDAVGADLYLGDWYSDGLVGEDYIDANGSLDADYGLSVYDDGTFFMTYASTGSSDSVEGTWEYDEQWDEASFSANGTDLVAFVEDGELYMDYDGTNYIVFVR